MNRSLVFKFFGIDAGAGREFDKMAAKSEATKHAIGKLALGAAATAGVVGAVSVAMAAKFQTSMTALVTGAGESEGNLKLVGDGILTMSGQVGESAAELAKGMYLVESAGYHGAGGLKVLKAAAEGAKVGQADMATVADAVTSALNSYHLPASKATAVTNELIVATKTGKMHMEDLAEALGNILPSAAALHVPLSQVVAGISTMTMQGTAASKATTSMRYLLSALVAPSSKASDALLAVGLSTKKVGDSITRRGLPSSLQMITDAVGKKFPKGSAAYVAALSSIVGGVRGMTAALEMTGRHLSTFKGNAKQAADAASGAGTSVKGWALVQEDFSQKMDRAKASVQALFIRLGTALLPAATKFADFLSNKAIPALSTFGGWVKRNSAWLAPLAVAIGTAVAVGFTIVKVVKMWTAAQLLLNVALDANPIGAVIVGVAALAAGLIYAYKHSETFRNITNAAFHTVGIAIGFVKDHWRVFAMAFAAFIGGPILLAIVALVTHFNLVKRAVGTLVSYAVKGFQFLFDAWMTVVGGIITGAAKMFGWVPGLGGKLKHAAAAFSAFRATADAAMAGVASDAASWGVKTGAGLAQGVDRGLAAYANRVQSNGFRFGLSVANAVRNGAAVKSPSKITTYVGKMLAEGLVVGFKGATAHVLHSLSSATQSMVASIGGRIDHWLGKFRSRVLHARDKLAADLQAKRDDIAAIRDSLVGGADITGAFGTDDQGNNVLGNVGSFLSGKLSALKTFFADMAKLRKMGLAPGILRMIVNAGPDQGDQLAKQILSGQAGSAGSLNATQAAISSTAAKVGGVVGGATYDKRIAEDRKHLRESLHEQKKQTQLLHGIIAAILGTATTPDGLAKALRKLKRELGHDLGLA